MGSHPCALTGQLLETVVYPGKLSCNCPYAFFGISFEYNLFLLKLKIENIVVKLFLNV